MYNRENLLIQTALLFYEKEMTQTEIAKKLKISRPTVASLLKEAKDTGIVKISIQHPSLHAFQRQQALEAEYGLDSVLVAPTSSSIEQTKAAIGELCATLVESKLNDINNLGIGWGTTMHEFVQAASYTNFNHLNIVPLMGGVGISDMKYHSNHLVFSLAQKYDCSVNYFYAPAIAESQEMKLAFESSSLVQEVYQKGRSVDLAVIGVGNPIKSSTYRQLGFIDQEEAEAIDNSGAVGDILATFFDDDAEPVSTSISDRMIGIPLEDITKMKEVVVFAAGIEKADSVKALLSKKFIHHLIIDDALAEALLT